MFYLTCFYKQCRPFTKSGLNHKMLNKKQVFVQKHVHDTTGVYFYILITLKHRVVK